MPAFELKCDPAEKIEFKGNLEEEMTVTELKLTNASEKRRSFKVKCTSNDMFRIRPPVGFVEKGESATIKLQMNKVATVPENGKHYFALYHIDVAADEKGARPAWAQNKGEVSDAKKLYINYVNESKKADAKKDDAKKDDDKDDDDKDDDKKDDKDE